MMSVLSEGRSHSGWLCCILGALLSEKATGHCDSGKRSAQLKPLRICVAPPFRKIVIYVLERHAQ